MVRRAFEKLERFVRAQSEGFFERLKKAVYEHREAGLERLRRAFGAVKREARTLERELGRAMSRVREAAITRSLLERLRAASSGGEAASDAGGETSGQEPQRIREAEQIRELERLTKDLRRMRAQRKLEEFVAQEARQEFEELPAEDEREIGEAEETSGEEPGDFVQEVEYGSRAAEAAAQELAELDRQKLAEFARHFGLETRGRSQSEIAAEVIALFDFALLDAPPGGAEFRASFGSFQEAADYASTIPIPTYIVRRRLRYDDDDVIDDGDDVWEVWVEDDS